MFVCYFKSIECKIEQGVCTSGCRSTVENRQNEK